jgi:YD repeat-containing protein
VALQRRIWADGASYTTYTYQGNFTTVVDPAGKWKQYASDAFGNLVTVLEPDPTANPVPGPPATPPAYPVTAAPTGMLLTSYTYDQVNHLTQVAMSRNTADGMVTQTRTFVYAATAYGTVVLPALWLTSATNPESGTVSYTYNADGTLASKTDANCNTESYSYDAYPRLTGIPDRAQTFTYDACPTAGLNPVVECVNAPGQLMQATFGSMVGTNELSFEYKYAYTPAGRVSSKTLEVQSANNLGSGGNMAYGALTASYAYDGQGALTSVTYPQCATWAICSTQSDIPSRDQNDGSISGSWVCGARGILDLVANAGIRHQERKQHGNHEAYDMHLTGFILSNQSAESDANRAASLDLEALGHRCRGSPVGVARLCRFDLTRAGRGQSHSRARYGANLWGKRPKVHGKTR